MLICIQRCIVLGSCYEPEIDKAAAQEIVAYLMAGEQVAAVSAGTAAARVKGVGEEEGEPKAKAKLEG